MGLQTCSLCQATYERLDGKAVDVCSSRCELIRDDVHHFGRETATYENKADTRIFFYDVGFGDLCDRLTILTLRYHHQKALSDRQQTAILLQRVKQSILTKANRVSYSADEMSGVITVISDLLTVNANIWRLRNDLRTLLGPSYGIDADVRSHQIEELSGNLIDASDRRDSLRSALDQYMESHVRIVRVWN